MKKLLILLFLTIPSFSVLMQGGYFPMHDDLQSMRQLQMDKCFKDGQIPCRWVSDMGFGFGYPLFNYYPPFPYYLGQIFVSLGFVYIDTVKIVGILGFLTAALFSYYFFRSVLGEKAGIIGSLLYTYAPYHSTNIYVRGAFNEFWAMAFFPAIFLFIKKVVTNPKKGVWIILTAIFTSFLMLSHNPMLMIFAPIAIVWSIYLIVSERKLIALPSLILSAILSLGLSAFFTVPVLLEQKYVSVWTLTSGYFNYLAHFADLRQMFVDINWGYGSSELGPVDGMSFAIGYLHWTLPVLGILILFTKKISTKSKLLFCLILIQFLIYSFMYHSKSTPIWKIVKPLEFLQFPWRFLSPIAFLSSFASAFLFFKAKKIFVTICIVAILFINGQYFVPKSWDSTMNDETKFSGKSWQLMLTASIFDYLPIWAPRPPAFGKQEDILSISGEMQYQTVTRKSNFHEYKINVIDDKAQVEIQSFYFPGWQVSINGDQVEIDPTLDKELGRIRVDLNKGENIVILKLGDTPTRQISNIVSLVSMILAGGYLSFAAFNTHKHRNLISR